MPDTVTAGPTVFVVTNSSTDTEHSFEIESQGMEEVFETPLPPGATQTMQVELQPGTYEVYCPVADHDDRGMEMTLTVVEEGTLDTSGNQ